MDIDLLVKISIPLLAAALGAYFKQVFERKAKLIVYYGHTSSLQVRSVTPAITIHTHSLIIRNTGKVPVTNIRLGHFVLPEDYSIYPHVAHSVARDGAANEIIIEKLIPKEQISVSYMYSNNLTYNQVNSYVKHNDGWAKVIKVLPMYVPTKFQYTLLYLMVLLGIILSMYIFYDTMMFLYKAYWVIENYQPPAQTPMVKNN